MKVPNDRPELTAAEIEAMAETVARVKIAVAEIVARERRRPQGLIERGRLTRDGLNAAIDSLGLPPACDQEWNELQNRRGRLG